MRQLSRIILFVLFPAIVHAGISDNPFLGIKSAGMGGSITSLGMDGSAAFNNPATMTFLKKNYINAAINFSSPNSVFLMNTGDKYNSLKSNLLPISLYGVYKFTDKVDLGLAVNNPFQNKIAWDENWAGKYICTANQSNVLNIQPTISYRVNDKFSVGGGLMVTRYNQKTSKSLNYESAAGDVMVDYNLNAIAMGLNLGVNYNYQKWHLGLSARTGLTYKAKGDATLKNVPVSLVSNGVLPASSSNCTSTVKLPAVISLGAGYELDENWLITMDVNIYNWTNIDSLKIKVENFQQCDFNVKQDVSSSYAIRFGARYLYSKKVVFRGGFAFDLSPVLDTYVNPAFPDYNRISYTTGTSYQLNKQFSFDAFIGFTNIKERKETKNVNNFNGTYKSNALIGGIGLNYEF
ncbi:MAG: OmpP1/FadL family transporter [Bacteroidota bacterium]